MHEQYKLFQGVYVTDYRKDKQLKGLAKQLQVQTTDVGLLLDEIKQLDKKIQQLMLSNGYIKQQQKWEEDQEFLKSIQQNLQISIKFSRKLKENLVWLFSLKYKPESEELEKLLDSQRIERREQQILQQLQKYQKPINEDKKIVQIKEQQQQDKGVFI